MSSSPRNPAVAEVLGFLAELDFRVSRSADGESWLAERHSGMFRRTMVFPDDPVVDADLIYSSFWQQAIDIRQEVTDLFQAMADDPDNQ